MKLFVLALIIVSISAYEVTLLKNGSNEFKLNVTETSEAVYDVAVSMVMGTFLYGGYSFVGCVDVGVSNFSLRDPSAGLVSFIYNLDHTPGTTPASIVTEYFPGSVVFDGESSYYWNAISVAGREFNTTSDPAFTQTTDSTTVTISMTGISNVTMNYLNFPNSTEDSYWKCWGYWNGTAFVLASLSDFAAYADVTSGNVTISKDYASGFTSLVLAASTMVLGMY